VTPPASNAFLSFRNAVGAVLVFDIARGLVRRPRGARRAERARDPRGEQEGPRGQRRVGAAEVRAFAQRHHLELVRAKDGTVLVQQVPVGEVRVVNRL
jgi:hypothetical protein